MQTLLNNTDGVQKLVRELENMFEGATYTSGEVVTAFLLIIFLGGKTAEEVEALDTLITLIRPSVRAISLATLGDANEPSH